MGHPSSCPQCCQRPTTNTHKKNTSHATNHLLHTKKIINSPTTFTLGPPSQNPNRKSTVPFDRGIPTLHKSNPGDTPYRSVLRGGRSRGLPGCSPPWGRPRRSRRWASRRRSWWCCTRWTPCRGGRTPRTASVGGKAKRVDADVWDFKRTTRSWETLHSYRRDRSVLMKMTKSKYQSTKPSGSYVVPQYCYEKSRWSRHERPQWWHPVTERKRDLNLTSYDNSKRRIAAVRRRVYQCHDAPRRSESLNRRIAAEIAPRRQSRFGDKDDTTSAARHHSDRMESRRAPAM